MRSGTRLWIALAVVVWLCPSGCVRGGYGGSTDQGLFDSSGIDAADDAAADDASQDSSDLNSFSQDGGFGEDLPRDTGGGEADLSDPCVEMTEDGIHLNPGCDPQVAANGITAISEYPLDLKASVLLVSGTRWWIFDLASWAFTKGGKNLAEEMQQYPPTCDVGTGDGLSLNPGCDPEMQSLGPSAMTVLLVSGKPVWSVTQSAKYWFFDPAVPAFVEGGAAMHDRLMELSPSNCGSVGDDGTPLNPGCDADVQSSGFAAMTDAPMGSTVAWAGFRDTRWWIYDPASETFVESGSDLPGFLLEVSPSCNAMSADGVHLNPGCDGDVQKTGFSATTAIAVPGAVYWFGINNKKWWLFEADSSKFVAGGSDIAALLRAEIPLTTL